MPPPRAVTVPIRSCYGPAPMRAVIRIACGLALLLAVGLGAAPASAQDDGEAARGRLVDAEREPLAGVEITVSTADGEAIETVTTGDDGTWEVALPGPGDYVAALNQDTLPEGAALRNPDQAERGFTVDPRESQVVAFPIGEGGGATSGFARRALQLFIEGVKFGLTIAMAAIGLSLIFGTTGLTNFAHGEIVTFGALTTYFFNAVVGLHLLLAAIVGIALTAIAGALFDMAVWRPLRKRSAGLIAMLVVSIGLGILIRYLYLFIFDGRTRPFAQYSVQSALAIGPIRIAPKDLVAIALSVAILTAVGLALSRTKIGRAIRAVADNPDLAEASGIDKERIILVVWAVGSALAALGGILLGLTEQVSWQMGFQLLLLMFAGITLGGLGTAYGALVGSLIVGVFIQMSTLFISTELKNVGALAILIVILVVRPQGILGVRERIG